MAFLTGLTAIAQPVVENMPGGVWEWLILNLFSFVKDYGWRIVLFTVLLKLILYPLDLYQRYKMRKNQKITERLKPEMDKLKKACGANTQEFQQKQMQLNKREGYSYMSACLPAIVTMVIFFWLFSGLNNISQYMIMRQYLEWVDVYDSAYTVVIDGVDYDNLDDDGKAGIKAEAEKAGQDAVYEYYSNSGESNRQSFLWIKNIWSPDVPWKKPILEHSGFMSAVGNWGKNSGKLAKLGFSAEKEELEKLKSLKLEDKASFEGLVSGSYYDSVTARLRTHESNKTNGILVLPILAAGLSFLSQFITMRQQKKAGQEAAGAGSMKFMMVLFPLMMIFFSVSYTTAFTLYIVLNSGMTVLLNLLTTGIFALKDRKADKAVQTTIIKYGRPDPNDLVKNNKKDK
ncbi:MAG: YidC/Oxa1 family membrane protein insertase [Clostridia bacterium]|nr:YidC/Oxa1 family membrane protein insertase [Clostridia bacterium]